MTQVLGMCEIAGESVCSLCVEMHVHLWAPVCISVFSGAALTFHGFEARLSGLNLGLLVF